MNDPLADAVFEVLQFIGYPLCACIGFAIGKIVGERRADRRRP